jgi:hypothetical protein
MIKAYAWWGLWVAMGKLIRLANRLDTWVRWQYAGVLAQEILRRQGEDGGPSVDH